jgi:hypothetical protein
MGRLTTLDLLLAEQGRAVLYCEGESDFNILRAWADILDHPSKSFFAEPFFHANGGRNPREAKAHLFALRAIHPRIRGLLLIDGDNRDAEDHEIATEGLTILHWKRYEIENYLLIPDAIRRLLTPPAQELFGQAAFERAMSYLKTQLPESFFADPLSDATQAALDVPASKKLLPQMFEAAGMPKEKSDFYLIAEKMEPREVHPDVKRALDSIAELLAEAEH